MRYFITFPRYGAHLHGEEGSVDLMHNLPGSRFPGADPLRAEAERQLMDQSPYLLDRECRVVVLDAIREVCVRRGWSLLAAHVRTNHVHVIVEGDTRPERMMRDFKSYASRSLNRPGRDRPLRKHWARHGSTRWLWKDEDVRQAIQYVVDEQGEPMAIFVVESWI